MSVIPLIVSAAVGGSKTSDETERNGSTDESPEQGSNGADHTLTEEVNNKVGTDSDEHDQVPRRRRFVLAQTEFF